MDGEEEEEGHESSVAIDMDGGHSSGMCSIELSSAENQQSDDQMIPSTSKDNTQKVIA